MKFIGQPVIIEQLKEFLPYLYKNKDKGLNFMLRGPSGWGKTTMAFMMCNYLTDGNYQYCLGDDVKFSPAFRVHFIDEVHLIAHPEVLYPFMDSGKYVVILATNDVSVVPEALSNRCTVSLTFDDYSQEDLRMICSTKLNSHIAIELLDYIIESAGRNPRVIDSIARRLNIILINKPSILDNLAVHEFKYLMEKLFGIKNGMDTACTRYLTALKKLGGTASLQTISSYIHIDQNTLKFSVEPVLLYKGKIQITSKGRILCE